MAVWLKRGRHIYSYDFTLDGRRYHGQTGARTAAEARIAEDALRRAAATGQLPPSDTDKEVPAHAREAWEAAVEVVAAAYALDPNVVRWQSRGRGPRPPKPTWEARKMAVHLAVIVSGCDYATIGRLAGLHRDTAGSHSADMRDLCAESDHFEQMSLAVELLATTRRRFVGAKRTALRSAA